MRLSRSVWKTIGSCAIRRRAGEGAPRDAREQWRAGQSLEVARVVQATVEPLRQRHCARADQQRHDQREQRVALGVGRHRARGGRGRLDDLRVLALRRAQRPQPLEVLRELLALNDLFRRQIVQLLLHVRDRGVDASDALALCGWSSPPARTYSLSGPRVPGRSRTR